MEPLTESTARAEQTYPFVFTGSAAEYFRIWIVNVFLTVITLGVYNAWAKVRTRRYFYAHTTLDGYAFDYLANPVAILKGNLIIAAGLVLFLIAQQFAPELNGVVVLGFYAIVLYLIYKSRDRLTNPNLEFTLFTDRSLSFNTATRLLLLDLQALAALERA